LSKLLLAPLVVLLLAASANAETLHGQVVSIADGDTITILDAQRQQHKIRLAQIDAPEKSQPFGMRSKQSLSDLAFGKEAHADCPDTDRYRRKVCRITIQNTDVNAEQLRRGMAWVYRQYARNPAYYQLEENARIARLGLWAEPQAVPPWEWRKQQRRK